MKVRLRISVPVAVACLLPLSAIAQHAPTTSTADLNLLNTWVVAGKVTTLRGDPVGGAKVELSPTLTSGGFRTLATNLQGEFQTEYRLSFENVKEFGIDLKVTKKGFLPAHSVVDFGASNRTWVIHVTLREAEEKSELLPQAELISKLAPRLRTLRASDGLSAAGEKDYARGVEQFLDRERPDRAVPILSKVTGRDVSCMPCSTMLALAQLDMEDWDGAYRNLVELSNKIVADPRLGRAEPLLVLGVMESWRHEPKSAAGYFVEALKYAPQDPLALQELGRSQLLIQNWGAADEYLGKAVAAGAGPEARLMHAEALLGGGNSQEANAEMLRYLDGRDVKTMPIQVRQLWVQIQDRMKIEATYLEAKPKGEAAIDYLHRPPPDLKGLDPATDQEQLDSILSAVGKTVAEFFQNFPNTSSLELIHSERLGHNHKAQATLDQQFQYLCFTPTDAWGLGFDEYRVDSSGARASPQGLQNGFMLTSGFASSSLLFHPNYQSQAVFRYLGRQKVDGRDTYVIAFAQQPAKARLNGGFKTGETRMTTLSQGLAWVDSKSYEIIRLRTDLLMPLAEVKLERATTEIAFGEVHFKGIDKGFLVPRQVTVTVDWNGRHLRNEHRYSDFKLFHVETTNRPGKPKQLSETSKGASDHPTPP
jgi:tetratricopeptide (TPR) repeat protein